LAQNSSLTTLDLTYNDIGAEGAKALGAALAQNSSLTTLHLSDYSIGAEGAKALGAALAQNSSLTTLHLNYNKIGAEGVMALGAALAQNSSLTTLDLIDNYISDDAAQALGAALAQNSSLTTLNLTDNIIGAEGAKALGAALAQNSSLTTLHLRNNSIGAVGAKALGAALAQNSSLTTLDLTSNKIGAEGAKALGAALAQNSSLTTLNLCGNSIGDKGAQALADSFEPISHSDLPARQPVAASSSADLVSSFFSVHVKVFNGDLLCIECSSHESIRSVKRKICEINSAYSAHRLQLVVERSQTGESDSESDLASPASSSVILSDALALSDYQITADDTLHLLLLPCKVRLTYEQIFVWNIEGCDNDFGLRFYLYIQNTSLQSLNLHSNGVGEECMRLLQRLCSRNKACCGC
jgi:Ran GTPase-activating protein (RanGAP) involved in mRNA processing and transport